MCRAALAAGIVSLRAPLLALRVARVVAALDGASTVTAEHAAIAARLVLAPRSAALSSAETVAAADTPDADQQATPAEVESRNGNGDAGLDGERAEPCSVPGAVEEMGGSDPDGIVLEAARAALPAGLLQQLGGGSVPRKTSRVATGRTEGVRAGRGTPPRRGRRIGTMPGDPTRARLDLLGTIRAALPWQTLRQAELPAIAGDAAGPLRVRRADFRVFRFAPRLRLVTIILLDASGSAARARLADAKGCVSVLLADCYARRDQVALIGCRNRDASLLLPPTGSVVRARRALDSLPGGGGTPLAAGLDAALLLAGRVRREGGTPRLLLLTDARANVARDGRADRTRAMQEAMEAARAIRAVALPALLVDISTRPRATGPGSGFTSSSAAAALAEAMGARSLSLGRGDADLPVRTAAALHAVEPGTGHG